MTVNQITLESIEKVAIALGELNKEVVFVGGAVVSLYVNDAFADEFRPTKDIDITFRIVSFAKLEQLREKLVSKGFKQNIFEDVICRFQLEDILVDVMSTQAIAWAPANRWFEEGFNDLIQMNIGTQVINLLSLPFFLATKFDAHADRGGSDARMSKDFEDIIYLLNHVSNLETHISNASSNVKNYLILEFKDILKNDVKQEAILANMPYNFQMERYDIIIEKLKSIVEK
jgi:Nucleotidyl transferase AbiEii toxin, Type IV TA system